MPIFTYEDERTGLQVDLNRPLEERNEPIVLRRVFTAPRVNMNAATEDTDFNTRMLRGYHEAECRDGSRFRSEHKTETIKQTWKE